MNYVIHLNELVILMDNRVLECFRCGSEKIVKRGQVK